MITNNYYECEYCHQVYHDTKQCLACERSHQVPFEIRSSLIKSCQTYPYMLMVEMTDGKIVKYWNTQYTMDANV